MENNSYIKEQQYIRAQKKVKSIRGFYVHFLVYLVVNIFLIVTRILSGSGFEILQEWQTYSTAIFWGIGIVFHAFGVFGVGFILGKDWEERKIKEIMDKENQRYWK